jgi:hypothetical protein
MISSISQCILPFRSSAEWERYEACVRVDKEQEKL